MRIPSKVIPTDLPDPLLRNNHVIGMQWHIYYDVLDRIDPVSPVKGWLLTLNVYTLRSATHAQYTLHIYLLGGWRFEHSVK